MRWILVLLTLSGSFHSFELCAQQNLSFLSFSGGLGLSNLSGYAQIPMGGSADTTSFQRPSFDEINLDHESFYEIGMNFQFHHLWGDIGYRYLSPSGTTILNQDLWTHARTIPKNEPFSMDVFYKWSYIGLGWTFAPPLGTLTPYLRGNYFKYHYSFRTPFKQSDRDFNLVGLTAGGILKHQFNPFWEVDIQGEVTVPLSCLRIYIANMAILYTSYSSRYLHIVPKLTMGLLRIDYEDKQKVPNHIRYEAQPYGLISLIILLKPL